MKEVILECQGIGKYFGGLKAVDEVDLKVHEGSIMGIIGPNGAGKTTLFNVCTGIYAPTKGRLLYRGQSIGGRRADKITQMGMARTFQNIQLFKDLNALENVKLGFHIHLKTNLFDALFHTRCYRRDEASADEMGLALLKQVGIEEYAYQKASNLPYGAQRKLEIARALAVQPKILLLDEPAAGMNPRETNELSDLIKELNAQGFTIVVIEHDMKFVMNLCHEITVLNFGRKIFEGTPKEVVENPEVRKAYLGERKAETLLLARGRRQNA